MTTKDSQTSLGKYPFFLFCDTMDWRKKEGFWYEMAFNGKGKHTATTDGITQQDGCCGLNREVHGTGSCQGEGVQVPQNFCFGRIDRAYVL